MARKWDPSTSKLKALTIGTGLLATCLASQTFAAGFQLLEQNVTNLGLAYSGTAALATDASTAFFNPAGLTRLGESQIVLPGFIIQSDNDLSITEVTPTIVIPTPSGNPLPANTVGTGSTTLDKATPLGAFYVSKRLDEKWVAGFAVSTPFGLLTEYDDWSPVRYSATRSKLETYDFSPNLGYRVAPGVSLGLGADIVYAKAVLETKIGYGNAIYDGYQNNRAEDWAFSWHAGILWEPTCRTRVGASYRAPINVHARGTSENISPVQDPEVIAQINGTFPDCPSPVPPIPCNEDVIAQLPPSGITQLRTLDANVTLPEVITFSLYHEVTECMALTADVAWTNWSRFRTLSLRFSPEGNGVTDTDTPEHFRDTRRFAVGSILKATDCLQFRAGVCYDQSPVRNQYRTVRIPDSPRTWLALGAGYRVNKQLALDLGYSLLLIQSTDVNEEAPYRAGTDIPVSSATIKGHYNHPYAHIAGMQIRYDFV